MALCLILSAHFAELKNGSKRANEYYCTACGWRICDCCGTVLKSKHQLGACKSGITCLAGHPLQETKAALYWYQCKGGHKESKCCSCNNKISSSTNIGLCPACNYIVCQSCINHPPRLAMPVQMFCPLSHPLSQLTSTQFCFATKTDENSLKCGLCSKKISKGKIEVGGCLACKYLVCKMCIEKTVKQGFKQPGVGMGMIPMGMQQTGIQQMGMVPMGAQQMYMGGQPMTQK